MLSNLFGIMKIDCKSLDNSHNTFVLIEWGSMSTIIMSLKLHQK